MNKLTWCFICKLDYDADGGSVNPYTQMLPADLRHAERLIEAVIEGEVNKRLASLRKTKKTKKRLDS